MKTQTANTLSLAKRSRAAGLTIVEILIIVAVVGVVAAFVGSRFIQDKPDTERIAAATQEVANITRALQLYKLDNRAYPTNEQGLSALVKAPTIPPAASAWKPGGYLEKLPNDPWGRPYQYQNPGTHGDIDVWSNGADGEQGGEDANADIGSW